MVREDSNLKIRSLFFNRLIEPPDSPVDDFLQVGIIDNDYEYLDLEELRGLRKFINETIMKMTFKTTINDKT